MYHNKQKEVIITHRTRIKTLPSQNHDQTRYFRASEHLADETNSLHPDLRREDDWTKFTMSDQQAPALFYAVPGVEEMASVDF